MEELQSGNATLTPELLRRALAEIQGEVDQDVSGVDTLWLLMCAIMVFTMQLGFAYVEEASVRADNVQSIVFKNLGDCCFGALVWWASGFGLAFGNNGSDNQVFGTADFFMASHSDMSASRLGTWLLSFVYGSAAATIVSGSVAERISLTGYYTIICVLLGFLYPVEVHWFWSDMGWFSPFNDDRQLDTPFLDFAGGALIHSFGGWIAVVAAVWLGPRKLPGGVDVFSEEGIAVVKAHDVFNHAVGMLMLWFAWFPFNAGGVAAFAGGGNAIATNAIVVTLLSGSAATLSSMIVCWEVYGYLPLGHVCNSALAGLVAATAGCAFIAPAFAPAIGVGGMGCYFGWNQLRVRLRIDDVIDAGAVHFACGTFGTLCVGLFADADRVRAAVGVEIEDGILLGGSFKQLGAQLLGLLVCLAWGTAGTCALSYALIKADGFRVPEEEELSGCDAALCGGLAFEFNEKINEEATKLRESAQQTMHFPSNLVRLGLQELNELEEEATKYRELVLQRKMELQEAQQEAKAAADEWDSPKRWSSPFGKSPLLSTSFAQGDPSSTMAPLTPMYASRGPPANLSYAEHRMPPPTQGQSEFTGVVVSGQLSPRNQGTQPSMSRVNSVASERSAAGSARFDRRRQSKGSKRKGGQGRHPSAQVGSSEIGIAVTEGKGEPPPGTLPLRSQPAALSVRKRESLQTEPDPGDYWEPQVFQLGRCPTPPAEKPPTPPDSEDHWDPTQQLDGGKDGRSDSSLNTEERIKLIYQPAPMAHRIRVLVAGVIFLGAITGAGAARDRFWTGLAAEDEEETDISNITEFLESAATQLKELKVSREGFSADLDALWVLFCGMLVFLMQLGFSFIEAGAIRAMNVQNIVLKNLGDCTLGALCWYALGYGVAYGSAGGANAFIGTSDFFLSSHGAVPATSLPTFFLSYVYGTTACTIVSGAVAERISLGGYYIIVVVVMCFSYPVIVHWAWSGSGWLSPWNPDQVCGANGLLDFAGSAVIHMSGGVGAMVAATIIGPRKLEGGVSVFSEEGQRMTAPHNKFNSACGTLMLWFSWFGFNAGSVGAFSGAGYEVAANAAVTTLIGGSAATVVALVVFPHIFGHYDLGHTCNAALAGLVAITAGCAHVSPAASIPIGGVAALCYVGWHKFRLYMELDDVLDASSVHFAGGTWGTLSVGLFADASRIKAALGVDGAGEAYGLFMGGGAAQFGCQLFASVSVISWATATMAATCWLIKLSPVDFRVPLYEELEGIDKHLCGGLTYDYLAQLEVQMEVAETAAEKIAAMRLDDLQYLWESENPSRLDAQFKNIVENLRQYVAYLPESVLGTEEHEPVATGADVPKLELPPQAIQKAHKSKGFNIGIEFFRSAHVLVATIHRSRDGWADAARSETRRGRSAEQLCEACKQPIISAEYCPATGLPHDNAALPVEATLNEWMAVLNACQMQQRALIESVLGTDAVLSFNTSKKATRAAEMACHSAILLRDFEPRLKRITADSAVWITVGIAGGGVAAGNVGSERQRRRTLLGTPVSDAHMLSALAASYGVSSLLDTRTARSASQQGFAGLREVANFLFPETTMPRIVYHIDACAPMPMLPEVRTYSGAWEPLLRGDMDEGFSRLTGHTKRHPTDKVALAVHQRVVEWRNAYSKAGLEVGKPFATQHDSSREVPLCIGAADGANTPQHGSPVAGGETVLTRSGQQTLIATPEGSPAGSPTKSLSGHRGRAGGKAPEPPRLVAVLVAQLIVDEHLIMANARTKSRASLKYGETLQTFASSVRNHGGAVAWAGDERFIARWQFDSEEERQAAVRCACDLIKTAGPFDEIAPTGVRSAALGLSTGPAWSGRISGETDAAAAVLSHCNAKAETLAACALAEATAVLVEGMDFSVAPQPGFSYEPIAVSAVYPRAPPSGDLHSEAVCRIRRISKVVREQTGKYKQAMQLINAGGWVPAAALLRACQDMSDDPWMVRLQSALRDAVQLDADELGVELRHSGVTLTPRRGDGGCQGLGRRPTAGGGEVLSPTEALKRAAVAAGLDADLGMAAGAATAGEAEASLTCSTERARQGSSMQRLLSRETVQHVLLTTAGVVAPRLSAVDADAGQRCGSARLRALWQVPVLLVGLWNGATIPTRIAFAHTEDRWTGSDAAHVSLDYICDAVLIADIVINFFTPYYDQGAVVTDRGLIAKRYLRRGLTSDVLSSLPWELLWIAAQGGGVLLRHRWVRINRIFRITNLRHQLDTVAGAVLPDADVRYTVHLSLLRAFLLLFLACIWIGSVWGLSTSRGDRGLPGFTNDSDFDSQPMWFQGAHALLIGMQGGLLGLFRRQWPQNDEEFAGLLCVSVVGVYLLAVVLGCYVTFDQLILGHRSLRNRKIDDLAEMTAHLLPEDGERVGSELALFCAECTVYHNKFWQATGQISPDEYDFLFKELPYHLSCELQVHANAKVLNRLPHQIGEAATAAQLAFAVNCVSSMSSAYCVPGEELLARTSLQEGIYFIYSGAARATGRQGVLIEELGPGDFWGEIVAIWGGVQRARLVCTAYSEVYVLSGKEFRQLAVQYPECMTFFWEKGMRRRERLERMQGAGGDDGVQEIDEDDEREGGWHTDPQGAISQRELAPSPAVARSPWAQRNAGGFSPRSHNTPTTSFGVDSHTCGAGMVHTSPHTGPSPADFVNPAGSTPRLSAGSSSRQLRDLAQLGLR
eukprot:TRINITY_DN5234_c0_g4_i1.p1 TRINITY_DN5234_c0_g4~~TRINITY_DN5234_c0_g4_i1.p1  ORF type:complete len:2710 (+),score=818.18 TRINITY_DN5234_c0_g4_i1:96-8132(+)